ncbi:MAG TPA: uroporphyrinogen-III synthase [Micrococcaceae bacterium]|nr:uroporphyrinogen-III synthase [Micrococcaceae bacterium]
MTESVPDAGSLAGLRVAVTRSPDRSAALVRALRDAGATPLLVPLIDFETAVDQGALDEAMAGLAAGEYDWLVISSITTVRALKQWCAARGTELAEFIPAGVRLATIGPTSRAILAAEGLTVDLAPVDVQSAAGLVELWPAGPTRVLLPQSNLAEPTLASGITAKGGDARTVTAYQTVDYPAHADRRLTAVLESARKPEQTQRSFGSQPAAVVGPSDPEQLSPADAQQQIRNGAIDAVVAASGSAARGIAKTLAPLPESCLLIAIGLPTCREAARLGMPVAGTAQEPTPAGIVQALADALATGRHPGHPDTTDTSSKTKESQ